MEKEKFESLKKIFYHEKEKLDKIEKTVSERIYHKLKSIEPLVEFLKENNFLFKHPTIKVTTHEGVIIGEIENNLLLVYCGGELIKTIDKNTGKFTGKDFTFLEYTKIFNIKEYSSMFNNINNLDLTMQEITDKTKKRFNDLNMM